MRRRVLLLKTAIIVALVLCFPNLYCQQNKSNANNSNSNTSGFQNSLAIRPIDLFLSIYTIQYERQMDSKNEIILGFYYFRTNANSTYPGTYQLYSPIIGYRRYLWKGFHLEYLLLPGYARYVNTNQNRIDNSFEIWNELHIGYRYEFVAIKIPLFITPQALFGFNLFKSNQPQSFKVIDDNPKYFYPNKLYIFPNINFGLRF